MRRFDWRLAIGAALVLLGGLMLLERADLLPGGVEVFWSASFLVAAAYFLYRFATDTRGDWWAAIPGFALAGLAAESLPASILGDLHGMFFLGALGLAFVAVYLSGRERWWALIPGGVLITLGLVAALATRFGVADNGGVLFVGIGLTFLLVAWLANMSWAYIPGIILLAMGALIGGHIRLGLACRSGGRGAHPDPSLQPEKLGASGWRPDVKSNRLPGGEILRVTGGLLKEKPRPGPALFPEGEAGEAGAGA